MLKKGDRTLQECFAEFILSTNYGELSREVVHQAKRCILDFMGVALAGSSVGLALVITNILSPAGGAAQAGLMAALLAQEGAEGPELLFEGEKGFFNCY